MLFSAVYFDYSNGFFPRAEKPKIKRALWSKKKKNLGIKKMFKFDRFANGWKYCRQTFLKVAMLLQKINFFFQRKKLYFRHLIFINSDWSAKNFKTWRRNTFFPLFLVLLRIEKKYSKVKSYGQNAVFKKGAFNFLKLVFN